jgi:uncharacterized Ntn-hydrolase superfamily protein
MHTYSIIARDPLTGEFGAAVQSSSASASNSSTGTNNPGLT